MTEKETAQKYQKRRHHGRDRWWSERSQMEAELVGGRRAMQQRIHSRVEEENLATQKLCKVSLRDIVLGPRCTGNISEFWFGLGIDAATQGRKRASRLTISRVCMPSKMRWKVALSRLELWIMSGSDRRMGESAWQSSVTFSFPHLSMVNTIATKMPCRKLGSRVTLPSAERRCQS